MTCISFLCMESHFAPAAHSHHSLKKKDKSSANDEKVIPLGCAHDD